MMIKNQQRRLREVWQREWRKGKEAGSAAEKAR